MITITEAAARAVKHALEEGSLPSDTYLRVRVKGGGCSGFSYNLSFESSLGENDRLVELDGVRVLIDPHSELYLAGTEMDYESGLAGQGFVFHNPNATGSCGCGKSFSV
jgi:iron-sulfur cluster assembly protein